MRVAVLDDYQDIALQVADWSQVRPYADITTFTDHLASPDEVAERLSPFDILCVMRERTPLPRSMIERLPNLKLIASTGLNNVAIDTKATSERGIEVVHTGYDSSPTIELAWALLMATVRSLPAEAASLRAGGWQRQIGTGLKGKTLGIIGLGRIGSEIARIGRVFGMEPIAWSENLTPEKAKAGGAHYASKEALLAEADVVTIHLVLSGRTRGLLDANAIGRMKPTAFLVNTSRGPIVDEAALIDALRDGRIAGAGIDVYDIEPLPVDHPFRSLDRLVATPHIGYVTRELYRTFYGDCVTHIGSWLRKKAGSTIE